MDARGIRNAEIIMIGAIDRTSRVSVIDSVVLRRTLRVRRRTMRAFESGYARDHTYD